MSYKSEVTLIPEVSVNQYSSGYRSRETAHFSMRLWHFFKRILGLFRQPVFIVLTIIGNLVVISSATLLYHLESATNPKIQTFLDSLWWAISTVTTVGYGDVVPISTAGRIVGIVTLIIGAALFWSYTALFAEALLARDLYDLEDELRSAQKALKKVNHSDYKNQSETIRLIDDLEKQIQNLKKSLSSHQ